MEVADLVVQAGALGIVGGIVWWALKYSLPQMVRDFRETISEQQAAFREDLARQRNDFRDELEKCRKSHPCDQVFRRESNASPDRPQD